MKKKPNVLLIEADQWPWFCMGVTGSPNVRTPNLDRLIVEGGCLFNDTATQSPICLPSRVSMLAGRYCSSVKQFGFTGWCERGIDWVQNVFGQAGYATGAFGKFHARSVGVDDWGFDVSAPTLPEDDILSKPAGNNYREYCRRLGIRWPTDQMHGSDPYGGQDGASRRSSHGDPALTRWEHGACLSDVPLAHSLETWTTDRCLAFIRERAADGKPFFSWLTYDRPHWPTTLPEPWFSKIDPAGVTLFDLPDTEALTGLPRRLFGAYATRGGNSIFGIGEERFRFVLASYYTLIEFIDSEIGRVLEELERHGLLENTTVVFTTDHGDEAGFNGLCNKSRRCSSEALTRVPLVIRPAPALGITPPRPIVDDPTENVDIFPTLCGLSGIACPRGVEGTDLAPFLRGEAALDPARPVFCEDYWQRMVKRDGWKMIFDIEADGECLLFDMNSDPNQFRNLYHAPDCADRRLMLKRELLAFLSRRLFGPFTNFDVERIRRGLDPADPMLPLVAGSGEPGLVVHFYRAAVMIQMRKDYQVFVPFYNGGEILLFDWNQPGHRIDYRTADQAIPFDAAVVERYMDGAIRYCMRHIPSASILIGRGRIDQPISSVQEAEELTDRLRVVEMV